MVDPFWWNTIESVELELGQEKKQLKPSAMREGRGRRLREETLDITLFWASETLT